MKKITTLLAVIAMVLGLSSKSEAVPVYFAGTGNYYDIVTGSFDWFDARVDAESQTYLGMAGHLATVTSLDEGEFIESNFAVTSWTPWIGGFQSEDAAEPDGDWQWVTGESFSYTDWSVVEPNNVYSSTYGMDEDYLQYHSVGGGWNDLWGASILSAYLIEYESTSVPEPSTLLLLGTGLVGLFAFNRKKKETENVQGIAI